MKYSFVAVLFAASVYAEDSTSTSSAASSTITRAPVYTPTAEQKCVADCAAEDMGCKAKCVTVPNPNSTLIYGLDQCMSTACVPKQTEAADNHKAYLDCQNSCIAKYYYNAKNTGGVPDVVQGGAASTGTASSGSGSNSGSSGSGSNSGSDNANSTESGASGTSTETGAKASKTGSAGNKLTFSMGGLVGVIGLAVLAL